MERRVKIVPKEKYHVYSRGVEKRNIFMDIEDKDRFMALLYISNQQANFRLSNFLRMNSLNDVYTIKKELPLVAIECYTLMPNHFHLLIKEIKPGGIATFLMRLLTAYVMYFNSKYDRSGPLFIHPYRSQYVSNPNHFHWLFSYIHMNPLKLMDKEYKKIIQKNKKIPKKYRDFLLQYKYSSYYDYSSKDTNRPFSKIIEKNNNVSI